MTPQSFQSVPRPNRPVATPGTGHPPSPPVGIRASGVSRILRSRRLACGALTLALLAGGARARAGGDPAGAAALGRRLFHDRALSADGTVSCASCHQPDHAFGDPRPVSRGVYRRLGTRHAPSLLDLPVYRVFSWDGRATTLAAQIHFPFQTPDEMGQGTPQSVVARVRQQARLRRAFHRLDGPSPLRSQDLDAALGAYLRTLGRAPIPLDRYLGGDRAALSPVAQAGLRLFRGRAHCATCHRIGRRSAPLTDNRFHTAAEGLSTLGPDLGARTQALAREPLAIRLRQAAKDAKTAALGRYVVTLNPRDIGRFRTPSLRTVAHSGPYLHDGSVPTLRAAMTLELYYRGLRAGHPRILSPRSKAALLAFLYTLSPPTGPMATAHRSPLP